MQELGIPIRLQIISILFRLFNKKKSLKRNKSIGTALFVDILTENQLKTFAFSTFYSDF